MIRYLIIWFSTLLILDCATARFGIAQPADQVSILQKGAAESIIVTAPRQASEAVINNFVQSLAVPSPLLGKMAKWKDRVCPNTVGLPPKYANFVTLRIREIATIAHAPVSLDTSCKPNMDIVFTLNPQTLLDAIRTSSPMLLGYHDVSQAKRLAKVRDPIQAWYATLTEDRDGLKNIDYKQKNRGVSMYLPPSPVCLHGCWYTFPSAREENVAASRLSDELRSEFYHVVVVADPSKLIGYHMGSVADYIAMLALSQIQSFDKCQQLPTIANLMDGACDATLKTDALSQYDVAFLRGLYDMDGSNSFLAQRSAIAYQMKKSLLSN